MKEIPFIEEDEIGEKTLQVISEADKFNKWMFNTIKPFCKGRILEIGSGIGNVSHHFLNAGYEIKLSDIRENYCEYLNKKFENKSGFLGTSTMNLTDANFVEKFKSELGTYDTVFALNVVEHIENDLLALENCKKLLKKGGHLVILVPSYNSLYNQFDTELGHYRRYTLQSLEQLFVNAKLNVHHKQYFNSVGILGWYVSGKLMKNDSIPKNQMSFYNTMVPVFKIVDKCLFNKVGLSSIVVGKK